MQLADLGSHAGCLVGLRIRENGHVLNDSHGYVDVRVARDDLIREFAAGEPIPRSILQRASEPWREDRIGRFKATQRQVREWISFSEIAEWCSELDAVGMLPNEAARDVAYETLHRDLLEGDFEENGRSKILYLNSAISSARMTRNWIEGMPAEVIRTAYLDHCWIPRSFFNRWLSKHHLPNDPPRFRILRTERPTDPTSNDETATILVLIRHLKLDPDLPRDKASELCAKEGYRFSKRGFQQRIWPKARLRAGLDEKAPPGRKRKTPHLNSP
jgi:hypothetical protein